MKNIFLFLFTLVVLTACNNDDGGTNPTPTDELDGTWKLQIFSGGFGVHNTYTNEIEWTFNTATNNITVTIASGTTINDTMPFKVAGSYTYTKATTNILTLNDVVHQTDFEYEIKSNELILRTNTSDPTVLVFKR